MRVFIRFSLALFIGFGMAPMAQAAEGEAFYSLKQVYEMARAKSEQLRIAQEGIAQARALGVQAVGTALGDFNFEITDFRQDARTSGSDSGVESTSNLVTRTNRRFTYAQPLFDGFRSYALLREARSLEAQRMWDQERFEHLLFLDVANTFYEILKLRDELRILADIHDLFESRIQELNEREAIGRSRVSELITARSRMKLMESDILLQDSALKQSLFELAFLTGQSLTAGQLLDHTEPRMLSLDASPALSLSERPDIRAVDEEILIRSYALNSAQAGFWPEVGLDFNLYDRREGFQEGNDWDVLVTFDIPIFDGGQTWGEVQFAGSDLEIARLESQEYKRQATQEVQQNFVSWQAHIKAYKILKASAQLAEKNFHIQKDEYTRNLVNNLEVLSSLEDYLDSLRQKNSIFYEMNKRYWQYQVSIGECCEFS